MTDSKVFLSRRFVTGAVISLGFLGAKAARAQISIGGFSTDDLKNIGKMLKGLTLGEEDEIRIGDTYYGALVDVSGGAYANRSIQADLDRFSVPLFDTGTRENFAWEITVIDNDQINAWVLPGGKVGVNKGLLRYVDNEHELAAVIAHEMGHAEYSHALSEMKKSSFADGLSGTTQRALVSELGGTAGALSAAGVGVAAGPMLRLVTSSYSRKNELEADQHILSVFAHTGHDVRKGCGIYQTLLDTIPKKAKGTTSLFAGHPDTQKRLDVLLEASENLPALNDQAEADASYMALKQTFPTRHHYLRNS